MCISRSLDISLAPSIFYLYHSCYIASKKTSRVPLGFFLSCSHRPKRLLGIPNSFSYFLDIVKSTPDPGILSAGVYEPWKKHKETRRKDPRGGEYQTFSGSISLFLSLSRSAASVTDTLHFCRQKSTEWKSRLLIIELSPNCPPYTSNEQHLVHPDCSLSRESRISRRSTQT